MKRDQPADGILLLAGLAAVYLLFEFLARSLGSYRGEYGLLIAAAVVLALLVVEYAIFGERPALALRKLGLGLPAWPGMIAALTVGMLICLVVPTFAFTRNEAISIDTGWPWLAIGLFAQAGIAEETLFRGYLFRHLREGRTFWRAAWLSMLPFAAIHLAMFAMLPWPIALASMLLALAISLPMAHVFEISGGTIWGAALLHTIIQGTLKVVTVGDVPTASLSLTWIAAGAVIPYLAFIIPRRDQ